MMSISHCTSTQESRSHLGSSLGLTMVILALVTSLGACGGDDDTQSATTSSAANTTAAPPATTASPTTTTAAPTTTTQPPSTTSTVGDTGETIFGWVRSFETRDGSTIVQVDQAVMLTGDEAVTAAREDGVIGGDEDLPNDFYIRNPDETTTELTVSPDVVVILQACYEGGDCVTTEQVDLATWSVLLGGEEDPGLDWGWYGAGSLPYTFTVADGLIVEIEEMYLP